VRWWNCIFGNRTIFRPKHLIYVILVQELYSIYI
jgi:hypothetical protein